MNRAEARAEVERLRPLVAASFRWQRRLDSGRVVTYTEDKRAALSDSARAACQWRPDPKLLDALVAAERALIRTYVPRETSRGSV